MEYISKDDERKALEKIRKIIDDLGADSYVAAAFAGCFEVAEDNITNDWAMSLKDQVNNLRSLYDCTQHELNELEMYRKTDRELIAHLQEELKTLKADHESLQEHDEATQIALNTANYKVEKLEAENTKLKAKLYDLISK